MRRAACIGFLRSLSTSTTAPPYVGVKQTAFPYAVRIEVRIALGWDSSVVDLKCLQGRHWPLYGTTTATKFGRYMNPPLPFESDESRTKHMLQQGESYKR